jgi:hypothetical protein
LISLISSCAAIARFQGNPEITALPPLLVDHSTA